MPNSFRDISSIPGVAQPRTQAQQELTREKARLWDETATVGTKPVSSGNFANPETNILSMRIDPGMKVADFGAGSGAYTLAAARVVGRSGRVYAVDVQKDLLTRIQNNAMREKIDWVDIVWGDFERPGGTKLRDKSIDLVIMSNVLFQLDHPSQAFGEAVRVLKKGGQLAVIDWTDSFGGIGPEDKRVIRKEKALEIGHDAGLTFLREFPAGAHHYGIMFKSDMATIT
ncbi:methyltransferase domain-containing protein [Candidatus Kaiserbacteria bacterium]|nr:methyltransferase domain-containing protein [Candidatus Kaiserbacteria bacterium]